MGTINDGFITLSKTYNNSYYNKVDNWFYNTTMSVIVFVESIDEDSNGQSTIISKGKSKSNITTGTQNIIKDRLKEQRTITISGWVCDDNTDPNKQKIWAATTLNGAISDTGSVKYVNTTDNKGPYRYTASITVVDTTPFPSSGMIMIDNEFIFYKSKDATHFIDCIRGGTHVIDSTSGQYISGYGNTVAATHSSGTTVYNRTDGAYHNKIKLLDFRERGGILVFDWRVQRYPVYLKSVKITDTKREHDGASKEPTRYPVSITLNPGIMKNDG